VTLDERPTLFDRILYEWRAYVYPMQHAAEAADMVAIFDATITPTDARTMRSGQGHNTSATVPGACLAPEQGAIQIGLLNGSRTLASNQTLSNKGKLQRPPLHFPFSFFCLERRDYIGSVWGVCLFQPSTLVIFFLVLTLELSPQPSQDARQICCSHSTLARVVQLRECDTTRCSNSGSGISI
jgi:hypothetical protein